MNRIISIVIVIVNLISISNAVAASYSLIIKLKSGNINKIPIADISLIKFENVTSIEDIQTKEVGNNPNPFSNSTTIEFELDSSTDMWILQSTTIEEMLYAI